MPTRKRDHATKAAVPLKKRKVDQLLNSQQHMTVRSTKRSSADGAQSRKIIKVGPSSSSSRTRTPKKKIWTTKEDQKLRHLVESFEAGAKSDKLAKWVTIADRLGSRSAKQCRERWNNHLRPGLKKGAWTEKEDALIMSLQAELGNQWTKIATSVPGRSDNDVKNRWYGFNKSRARQMKSTQCVPSPKVSSNAAKPSIEARSTKLPTSLKSPIRFPLKPSFKASSSTQPTVKASTLAKPSIKSRTPLKAASESEMTISSRGEPPQEGIAPQAGIPVSGTEQAVEAEFVTPPPSTLPQPETRTISTIPANPPRPSIHEYEDDIVSSLLAISRTPNHQVFGNGSPPAITSSSPVSLEPWSQLTRTGASSDSNLDIMSPAPVRFRIMTESERKVPFTWV